ncbi:MAG: hypothetical protein LRZ98_00150 [Candidatus Pacebacteria bacterium]|nr:hypothetical protein [Candidatus Paceibacterota bacterium]
MEALKLSYQLKILNYISEDLVKTFGITQGGAHRYDVFEHSLQTMNYAIIKN